jgi:CheY-like chemotaxis protein
MASARILVADDDPSVLESLSGVLRDSGFEVAAADGREALFRELSGGTPDLLLADARSSLPRPASVSAPRLKFLSVAIEIPIRHD